MLRHGSAGAAQCSALHCTCSKQLPEELLSAVLPEACLPSTSAGTLPSTWTAQGLLFHLRLSQNRLTGSLPPEWGRMRHLLTLDVSKNE